MKSKILWYYCKEFECKRREQYSEKGQYLWYFRKKGHHLPKYYREDKTSILSILCFVRAIKEVIALSHNPY